MANYRATGKKPRITSKKTKEARQKFTEIMQKLEHQEPELFENAFREGLMAPPPQSFQYLQMWAHYRQGKPVDRMELQAQHHTVARVVHEHLPALPEPDIVEGVKVVEREPVALPTPSNVQEPRQEPEPVPVPASEEPPDEPSDSD